MAPTKLVLAAIALLDTVFASGIGYSQFSKRSYKPHFPVCPYDFVPFVYVGCYQDPNAKTLRFNPRINGPDMTVEKCTSACKNNGFRYAGLEYYGQCKCGSTIAGNPFVDTGNAKEGCIFPCNGNPLQVCGGNAMISIYIDPTFPIKTVDELATAGADYEAIGCFSEVDGRTLTDDQLDINGPDMTIEKCLEQCGKQGYAYAGLEYGQECWCAGKIAPDALPIDDATRCNLPCKGNKDETCGGSKAIYIYHNSELESSDPCDDDTSPGTTTTTTTTTTPVVPTTTSSTTTTTTTEPTTTTTTTTTSTTESTTTSTTESTTTSTTESTTTTTTTTTESTTTTTTTTTTIPSTTTTTTTTPPPTTTSRTTTTRTTTTRTTTTSCRTVCGGYCAPPLPTFTDNPSCKTLVAKCWEQVNECMVKASNTDECVKLATGCALYSKYCKIKCTGWKCNKRDCDEWDGYYPPPKPTTPPKPTYTPPKPTYTPTPTNNVCVVPTAYKNPVGGCKAPVVSCNEDKRDYDNGNCWKVFSSYKTKQCASFPRNSISDACQEACNIQYENCRNQYAGSSSKPRLMKKKSDIPVEKRTWGNSAWVWSWVQAGSYDNYNSAVDKCKKQKDACIKANSNLNGYSYCKKFGYFK